MTTRQTASVFIGIILAILLAGCSSHRNETLGDEDRKYIKEMGGNPNGCH